MKKLCYAPWCFALAIFCAQFSTLLSPSVAVAADTGNDAHSISGLLQSTGVTAQIHSIETLVLESGAAHSNRCAIDKTTHAQIPGHIPDRIPGYSAESMLFDMLQGMNTLDAVDMKPVHRWYNSPLATKIQDAELQPASYNEMKQYLSVLKTEQHRYDLVQRIVGNTRAPQYVAIVGTEVEYAGIVNSGCIDKAQQLVLTGSKKTNSEKTLADITRDDKELTALLLTSEITLELAYKLRDLSLTELAQYEYFTASDEAAQFYTTLTDALHRSFRLATGRLALQKRYSELDF